MSIIKLYRNCKILEEKNFQVDDIEQYLASLTPVKTFDNAQYIKMGLDAEVKVTLDQSYLDKQWTNMYNYCSIEMDNGGLDNTYYYFIRKMQWISKDAIKLILHLDVLNTYKGAYKLTDKTTINRMHKDRFINNKLPYVEEEQFSFLDDAEWDWGTATGEIVGNADFDFSNELFDREVQTTITLVSGTGADVYETEWDKDFNTLHITAYVQGESSPIPQGKIKITVTSQAVLDNNIYRKVDEINEGIETVLFNRAHTDLSVRSEDGEETLRDSAYLIYKTNNGYNSQDPDAFIYNNAINCFFTTDTGYTRNVGSNVIVNASDLVTNERYFITLPAGADEKHTPNSFANDIPEPKAGLKINFVCANGYRDSVELIKVNVRRNKQVCYSLVKTSSNTISLTKHYLKRDNFEEKNEYIGNIGSDITFNNISQIDLFTSTGNYANNQNFYDLLVRKYKNTKHIETTSIEEKTSKPFSEVDRTDVKLIKIVKLPYAPYFGLDDIEWNTTENMFRLKSSLLNKNAIISYFYLENMNIVQELKLPEQLHTFTPTTPRNVLYESKLYNSDFFQFKLCYDSFNYVFRFEQLNKEAEPWLADREDLEFDYVISTSVASTFLFDFNRSWESNIYTSDYPNIMIVNRNLEVPIYNNYYLNYLRNGYNYDVKNKQAKDVGTGLGIGLSAASLVAGIALSATGVGSAMGAGAIIGGALGLAGSISSGIASSVQADRALQQKQQEAENQAATVKGADDIGLLSYYAINNKPQLVIYRLSDNTQERVADLFFYCGYKCEYQAIPDTTSRYWFNFIQCNPVYDCDNTTAKMSKDQKDELTAKYQEGVTVLHHHNTWDFNQEYENFETWLLE